MTELDSKRQALAKLDGRLAAGEIDEETYDRLVAKLTSGLTVEQRSQLGITPTPVPQSISGVGIGPSAGRTRMPSLVELELTPGTVLLDQWRIVRELGRGGFGAVFEAEDIKLDRTLALKVLDPSMAAREELLARFRREVTLMRELAHERIVRVYDYREDAGEHLALISMEYVKGCSVRELLALARASNDKVPVPLALAIFQQTLEALAAAHKQGVIHRDVTPGNILLAGGTPAELLVDPDRDPRVKLVDFGIAGLVERTELSSKSRVLGTAAYVAPEVLDPDSDVTPAADIYGAGALAYELLVGKPPVVTGSRFVAGLRCGVPLTLEELIASACSAQPERRPSAATSVSILSALDNGTWDSSAVRQDTSSKSTSTDRGKQEAPGAGASSTALSHDKQPARNQDKRFSVRRPFLAAGLAAMVLTLMFGILAWLRTSRGDVGEQVEQVAAERLVATPIRQAMPRHGEKIKTEALAPETESVETKAVPRNRSTILESKPAALRPTEEIWPPAGTVAPFEPVVGMKFRFVPSSPEILRGQFSQRRMPGGIWMSEKEVTQGEWKTIMGSNPSEFSECGVDCPVENVRFVDVIRFANQLSEREGLQGCYVIDNFEIRFNGSDCSGYRLPTIIEWLDAAQPHGEKKWGLEDMAALAWLSPSAGGKTHRVGTRAANSWGGHDLFGNVSEFVWDPDSVLGRKGPANEVHPVGGANCVVLGGSWDDSSDSLKSLDHFESQVADDLQSGKIGFRLARSFRR